MNTRSILLALCVSVSATTWAQTATTATDNTVDRARAQHEAIVKELALTPEQDEQLMKIEEQHRQSAKELNSANLDTAQRQERALALRDAKDHAIKGVLTPEQFEKFLAMRKEKRDNGAQQVKTTHQE